MPNEETELNEGQDSGDETITHEDTTQLNGRLARLEQNSALLTLMADEDVRAVVEAKRSGRKVRVSPADEPEAEPEPEPSIASDLDENDPVRQTLERVDTLIKVRLKAANDSINARLAGLEGLGNEIKRKDVTSQVDVARSKFKDLDQYKDAMVTLSRENPTLSVEDLYVLSKSRAGKLRQAEQTTFSEKPTSQPRRSTPSKPTAGGRPPERPAGRKGFSALLAESLNEATFGDKE